MVTYQEKIDRLSKIGHYSLTTFSLAGVVLGVVLIVCFQILDLSHGHTNEGWVSDFALLTMGINMSSFLILLASLVFGSSKKIRYSLLAALNFLTNVWIFAG
jgi:hypothetical protein